MAGTEMLVGQLLTPVLVIAAATAALITGHLTETAFVALLAGAGVVAPAATKIGEVKR